MKVNCLWMSVCLDGFFKYLEKTEEKLLKEVNKQILFGIYQLLITNINFGGKRYGMFSCTHG